MALVLDMNGEAVDVEGVKLRATLIGPPQGEAGPVAIKLPALEPGDTIVFTTANGETITIRGHNYNRALFMADRSIRVIRHHAKRRTPPDPTTTAPREDRRR